ncbi:hypothetical protein KC614_03720 [candidate division WWE3 bacterium]|uniref:Uncharacterized protein n=1 Tax=candidate division WWE3 bacterium TaxID=2053526 RepID=A0A955LKN0_UNCKA|nr:hypothetical protein [candidate division WWE3 bacterium]
MLSIVVLGDELWNEETNEFSTVGDVALEFEHSLVSLSKWEAKYEKPFLGKGKKEQEEVFGYLKEMCLTPNVDEEVFYRLSDDNLDAINKYIESKQSATTFGNLPKERGPAETITAELIYYWLVAFQIPFDPCETWHLNRLFSLIRICSIKNTPPKKVNRAEMLSQRSKLNAQRRAQLGTRG